jgi:peptide deformylase
MAKLTILEYPDPRLRTKATPVHVFDRALRQLADDMLETMYNANGVGLAATQVNVHTRLLICDVSEERNQPHALANPQLLELIDNAVNLEGCLSVPGIFEDVERARRIRVEFQDPQGARHELEADGLLAVCIQHEMDHLQGKVFVEYLSQLKQQRIRAKLAKQLRKSA